MSQCSLPSAPAALDERMPTKGHVPALPRIHDDAQYVRPAVTGVPATE
jgi:hypothetical protein